MSRSPKIIMPDPVVRAKDVTRVYSLGEHLLHALNGVSIEVMPGDFLAIAGPSGSGKTTLLNMLACIDRPSSGEIFVEGIPTRLLGPDALADFRSKKIGFIFQTFNLIPTLSALENVEYPLLLQGVTNPERKARSIDALKRVGLASFLNHRPSQLRGGQRQRVAIARAIVKKPLLVLADEPTANLDKKTANEVLDLMQDLHAEARVTFVFSSHDSLVLNRAQKIVPLIDGKEDSTQAILDRRDALYVA